MMDSYEKWYFIVIMGYRGNLKETIAGGGNRGCNLSDVAQKWDIGGKI